MTNDSITSTCESGQADHQQGGHSHADANSKISIFRNASAQGGTSLAEMRRELERDSPMLAGAKIRDDDLRLMWDGTQALKARRDEMRQAKDFTRYLHSFGGHECFQAFLEIRNEMTDEDYWKCLAIAWESIEVSSPHSKIWLALFESKRTRREALMTPDESQTLAALPDTFTVYRGYAKGKGSDGLSWTLSETVARFFADYATGPRRAYHCGHDRGRAKMIVTGQCRKRDVLAYLNSRNEEEIVIRPENVLAKRSREIKPEAVK